MHHHRPPLGNAGRRRWLGAAVAGSATLLAGCGSTPWQSGHRFSEAPTDRSSPEQAWRLANRLSWGATGAEVARVQRWGAEGYIARQLAAAAGPMPEAAQAQIDALNVQRRSPQALWTEIDTARRTADALPTEAERKAGQDAFQAAQSALAREAMHRHLLRALYSPNQLLEQLQWFWFNHFNVFQFKANIRVLLADFEEQAIRPHALGRFRDLLGAVTTHPAMLRYLDNEQNAANRLNENFARELLELHTLGVDAGYSQRDVQELARVLTGHGVNFNERNATVRPELQALYHRKGFYEFNPVRHDAGEKRLLGLVIAPAGRAELARVLDHLAVHPATARLVSGKLARHFLGDAAPPAVVDRMVAAWARSGGDLAVVLGVLLRDPAFTAPGWVKFKDPVRYVVSAVRAAYGEQVVQTTQPIQGWLVRLGQGLYNRQTPDGYPAAEAYWTGSGQLAARLEVARAMGGFGAGLFKGEVLAAGQAPTTPLLNGPVYRQVLRPLMAEPTRRALDQASSVPEWNALFLASPEFMYA